MAGKKSAVNKSDSPVTPQQAAFQNFGISGVTRYGAISRVYEEFLRELQGPAGMKLLREQIDNCPITGAILFTAQYLARSVTFRVDPSKQPGADPNRAEQVAERIKGALFDDLDLTWPDLISEIFTMLGFGWAVLEMTFKKCQGPIAPQEIDPATGQSKDGSPLLPPALGPATSGPTGQGAAPATFTPSKFNDGFLTFKSLGLRAQETLFMWEWDEDSNARVLQQMAPPDYRVRRVPLGKCLHFRTQVSKGNPEGRALIRNAVPSYLYAKNIRQIEAIGVERDLAGYPYFQTMEPDQQKGIYSPDIWNPNDPNAVQLLGNLKSMVRSIRRNDQEGMVLPFWLKFNLASTGSRRAFDTNAIVTRYESRIAMSVMADFIMIGHDSVGSKALASTKSQLFTAALGGLLDNVCAVFNRFGIPMLMQLNGLPPELTPVLAHADVENVPLESLSKYISDLAGAGMPLFPDADLEEALRDMAKLPTSGVRDPDAAQDEALQSETGDSQEESTETGPPPKAIPAAPVKASLEPPATPTRSQPKRPLIAPRKPLLAAARPLINPADPLIDPPKPLIAPPKPLLGKRVAKILIRDRKGRIARVVDADLPRVPRRKAI